MTVPAQETFDISLASGGFRVAPEIAGRDYGGFWRRVQSGAWEPETLWLLDALLAPGSAFYDVGAWIGPTTLFAAMKGARVVAYEPDPVARHALLVNLALNADIPPVEVRPYALGASRTRLPLFSGELGNSESSLLSASGRRGAVTELQPRADVECRVLREELAGIAPDAVVKIDVEGGEFDIFSGAASAPPAGVYVVSLHGCNLVAARAADSGRLRVERLNALLDAFADFRWHRLTRWGLLELDQASFRRHSARRAPPIDELVFSRAPLPCRHPRSPADATTLWASDGKYQPWRAVGDGTMGLLGYRPVSIRPSQV
ncbi:MAG: FkbM family methyltransferase [Caulobacterales bacterium]